MQALQAEPVLAIASLTTSFEQPLPARQIIMPRSVKASREAPKSMPESNSKENSMSSRIESLTIQEDVKEDEAEDEEGLPIYPYERLKVNSRGPTWFLENLKGTGISAFSAASAPRKLVFSVD